MASRHVSQLSCPSAGLVPASTQGALYFTALYFMLRLRVLAAQGVYYITMNVVPSGAMLTIEGEGRISNSN